MSGGPDVTSGMIQIPFGGKLGAQDVGSLDNQHAIGLFKVESLFERAGPGPSALLHMQLTEERDHKLYDIRISSYLESRVQRRTLNFSIRRRLAYQTDPNALPELVWANGGRWFY